METEIHIEEILTEANAYYQRDKVKWYAEMLIDTVKEIDRIDAYQSAYKMFIEREEL